MQSADQVIAEGLGIAVDDITEGLEYQAIPQWNSLGHVSLMMAIERASGMRVDDELTLSLRSVAAIREFFAASAAPGSSREIPADGPSLRPNSPETPVHRGLDGIVLDRTSIARIDGDAGTLEYRGYSIHDLAEHAKYEEVAYLLTYGDLPAPTALDVFRKELRAKRNLPEPIFGLLRSLTFAHPVDALRTCVSALGALAADSPRRDESLTEARDVGLSLLARVPMIVAAHHAMRSGFEPVAPSPEAPYTEAFLTTLLNETPSPAAVRFVDKGFIVHADHSSNASTLAARVAIGSHAGMISAVTAALAVFAGSLHGGAAELAVKLIDEVGAPQNAERYVADRFARNLPVMGFGHRVYRTEDPRVRHLRETVVELSQERGDSHGLAILDAVAEAMQPYARHGLAPNVDLYAGLAYRLLGLPDDLAVAMFAIGRTAGWVAHALEQHANNVLIRPLLAYQGPASRLFPGAAS